MRYKRWGILTCIMLITSGCSNESVAIDKKDIVKEDISICKANQTLRESEVDSFTINGEKITIAEDHLDELCKSDISLNLREKKEFLEAMEGNYIVDKFETIHFFVTSYPYDPDYITNFIKNSIENNKDIYDIKIGADSILFENHSVPFDDISITFQPAVDGIYELTPSINIGLESPSIEENPYYNIPVDIAMYNIYDSNHFTIGILFLVEEYDDQFLTYVTYKKEKQ